MNIVYVETQRKDGTWKTWDNVAIPVKFGKLLDEQLDYAQVTLTRIKKNRFIPMTKARITVVSETDEKDGIINLEYLVADDVSEETPVGSGIFNHTLTLIEYTKFLECFPLETLCFTNPRGNNFETTGIPPSIIQGQEISLIDYPSNYVSPSGIGKTYNLFGYRGLGTYETLSVEIKIEDGTGITYNFAPASLHTITDTKFTIRKGINTISYIRKDASGNVLETTKLEIYGVENYLPLAPYTINEVIQRILQLVEPLRKNETPRFTFEPPTGKEKVFNQFAPEFTFTRSTLRETLQQIGGHIHAEPRLTHENEIVWDFYGEEERAEYTNYKTGETKPLSEYKYHTLQRKRNLDDTANALDSYQDNLVNRLNWGNSTTATPYDGAYQTLRMETAWLPSVEENSYHIETAEPIDRIVSVKMRVDGKEKPITPYIYEKKVYDNLSGISQTYPNAKVTSLYYTQGQKGIYGLFYKNPSIWGDGIGKNYAITNIYNYAFGKSENKLDYNKIQFCVEYVPIYSTRVQQTKQIVQDFLPLPRTVNYTQSANSVETQYFGEHIKAAIARMGNAEKNISMNFRHADNIPKVGKLFDDEYYISECSVSVLQDHFECTLGLSKNFNRKSKYIGASSIKRIYEVSEEQVQERHTVLQDYLVITDKGGLLGYLDDWRENGYLGNALGGICAMFNGVEETADYTVAAVNAFGLTHKETQQESVLLPVITSAFGNTIEFTWRYKDNFSAGFHAEEKFNDSNKIERIFTVETEYTDYYGRLYYYNFGLRTTAQANVISQSDADLLPEYNPATLGYVDGVAGMIEDGSTKNPLLLRKDGRETLKFTYNINFVTDNNKFVLGSALTANNPLITKDTRKPHLYVLPNKINRFANVLDLGNATDLGEVNEFVLNNNHIYCNGKISSVEGEAWAYAYPQEESGLKEFENESGEVVQISTQTGGELILGKNQKVTKTSGAGYVRIYHVHDIYKYYEFLKGQNN